MWKCKDCIHKDKFDNKLELCVGLCKDVFTRLNRENHCYQKIILKPLNCGNCSYIKDGQYCSVMNWNFDDKRVSYNPVRKNYLIKNTPKWCQLK